MTKDNAALVERAGPEPVPNPPASMSLFRYSPGLLLVTIAIADAIRLPDPDMWGNVRFGQEFLSQHTWCFMILTPTRPRDITGTTTNGLPKC